MRALGETRRAIELCEQHLVIVREISDRGRRRYALGNLGSAYRQLGEIRRAIEFCEQALAIHREVGDRRGRGSALGGPGQLLRGFGRDPAPRNRVLQKGGLRSTARLATAGARHKPFGT